MRRLALAALAAALLAAPAAARPNRDAVHLRPFLSGLDQPVYVTSAPGQANRLYVVEKTGRIRVAQNGRLLAKPLLDLRGRVSGDSEQGLLSAAFHPGYASNHRFYVDYTDRNGDTRVVEYRTKNGRGVSPRQLLFVDQPYPNHNGGQLQFGPDGDLYVGMGDGGSGGDPGNRAQNLSIRLGKLLKIAPLARSPRWQVAGYGLRNPWRFSFDRANGNLVIGDVGQNRYEEIDFTPRSSPGLENYGWRVYEGRSRYTANQQPSGPGKLVFPVYVYAHQSGRCSITGGYVYRGSAMPAERGRYFFGDYCTGEVWSAVVGDGSAAGVRQEPFRVPGLSSFGQDSRGELYAVSIDSGKVYKLVP